MPATALQHFQEDIARSKAILTHASPLPHANDAEKLLRIRSNLKSRACFERATSFAWKWKDPRPADCTAKLPWKSDWPKTILNPLETVAQVIG